MAELASTRVFGKLSVLHDAILKANAEITGKLTTQRVIAGGSEIINSDAALQVNGFMRTGSIYLHEGGNTPNGDNLSLRNSGGELTWNNQKVWNEGNDGDGSGLDADKLDGKHADSFLRSDTNATWHNGSGGVRFASATNRGYLQGVNSADNGPGELWLTGYYGDPATEINLLTDRAVINGNTIWNAGNDGSGSGLDADKLDGFHSDQFVRSDIGNQKTQGSFHVDGSKFYWGTDRQHNLFDNDGHGNSGLQLNMDGDKLSNDGAAFELQLDEQDSVGGTFRLSLMQRGDAGDVTSPSYELLGSGNGDLTWGGHEIWHAGNDGPGSGLNADTVDGVHAGELLKNTTDNFNGVLTFVGEGDGTGLRFAHGNDAGGVRLRDGGNGNSGELEFWTADDSEEPFVFRTYQTGQDGTGDSVEWFRVNGQGVTFRGNTVWHEGNDGAGSGLDADKLDGAEPDDNPTANTIMQRDAAGDTWCRLFRSTYSTTNADVAGIYTTRTIGGDFMRPSTPDQVKAAMALDNVRNVSSYSSSESDERYYTKTDADSRYYTKGNADSQFYSKSAADSQFYSKSESNSRYYTKGTADSRFYRSGDSPYFSYVNLGGDARLNTNSSQMIIEYLRSSIDQFEIENSSGSMQLLLSPDGLRVPSSGSNTTSGAANTYIYSNGTIRRSTSSIKYKTDVEDAERDSYRKVLEFRPIWYRSACEGDVKEWSHWGFIAEELAEIDKRLVNYAVDENGDFTDEPEGVAYDRITVLLQAVVRDQEEEINNLKKTQELYEERIAALEQKMEAMA